VVEAHTTVAGKRDSAHRLDKLNGGRTTFAVDRVDVRLHHTVRSPKRDEGVDRCSPLDPQCDVELLHCRVQVRHDEADVKERDVDGRRRQLECHGQRPEQIADAMTCVTAFGWEISAAGT